MLLSLLFIMSCLLVDKRASEVRRKVGKIAAREDNATALLLLFMPEEDTLVGIRGTLAMARSAADAGDASAEATVVDPPAAASASFHGEAECRLADEVVLPVVTASAVASARGAATTRVAADASVLRRW